MRVRIRLSQSVGLWNFIIVFKLLWSFLGTDIRNLNFRGHLLHSVLVAGSINDEVHLFYFWKHVIYDVITSDMGFRLVGSAPLPITFLKVEYFDQY